jgi:hypothetical protein
MKSIIVSIFVIMCLQVFLTAPLEGEYFDWRAFGEREEKNAPSDQLQKARYIAIRVGQELKKQGIQPNYSVFGRARAFVQHGDQSIGTCNDLAEILKDALSGAGFDDSQLFTVLASKKGFARFKKGWVFDVNLDHAAAVLVINDTPYSFDLWAHGGTDGTFDGFDRSIWNGLELKAWGSTLQNYDYSVFTINPGKRSQSNPLDLTSIIKLIVHRAGQKQRSSQPPSNTLPVSSSAGTSQNEQILNEYRSLYPSYLRKFHQGNRVEVLANAVLVGDRYKCAYKTYCIVKDGPRKGEEYVCASFERLFTLADLRGLIPVMKKELSKS